MDKTSKIKQINFRINPDTADAFRKFCNKKHLTQAAGFDLLMTAYESNHSHITEYSSPKLMAAQDFCDTVRQIASNYSKLYEELETYKKAFLAASAAAAQATKNNL